MMSLESSRVNVGNIYLLLTVCVILYIGRMLFKNKTETKSFETNETFADINMKICPYLVKTLYTKSFAVFGQFDTVLIEEILWFRFYIHSLSFCISSCLFMYTFGNEDSLKGKLVL